MAGVARRSPVRRNLSPLAIRVIGQSRSFVTRLAKVGVPEERLEYLPNWGGRNLIKPISAPAARTEEWENAFLGHVRRQPGARTGARYSAGCGDSRERRSGDPLGHFSARGAPARMDGGKRRSGRGLTRVHFLGRRPAVEMPGAVRARAGAMLVSLKRDDSLAMNRSRRRCSRISLAAGPC